MRAAPADARTLAARVLERVTHGGAFASVALDAELHRAALSPRDAAFATELVYGTLRVLPALDGWLAGALHQPGRRLDASLQAALRIAAYQLRHMPRVPVHAAVDAAVSQVRAARGERLAALANAVLRKLSQSDTPRTPPTALSVPDWLARAFEASLGAERARVLCALDGQPPPLCLRVCPGHAASDVASALAAARPGAEIRRSTLCPDALLLRRAGDPRALPGYAQGAFVVQEEGAQLVARALGARSGEQVADLCAGHGGKTLALAQAVGAEGHVDAADLDERKLERCKAELTRHGVPSGRVQLHPLDLSVGTGPLAGRYDRVLVDAPCSGLGTLRRRPELCLRVGPDDPARLGELQLSILRNAVPLVREGGVLVFSVCSPLAAEGPLVALRLEALFPGLSRLRTLSAVPDLALDDDGVLRIGPWSSPGGHDSPDAYQVIAWQQGAG